MEPATLPEVNIQGTEDTEKEHMGRKGKGEVRKK
jgi:hypothetical protein